MNENLKEKFLNFIPLKILNGNKKNSNLETFVMLQFKSG